MKEPLIISEVTGFPVKPMPGASRWLQRRFWPLTALVGFVAMLVTGSYIPFFVSVVVALVVTIAIVCHVRCPLCKSPLASREVAETKDRRRLYYDCSKCQVTWQSELVNEDWS
jgi:hypothetical protein